MIDGFEESEGEPQPQCVSLSKENFRGRRRLHPRIAAVTATMLKAASSCQSIGANISASDMEATGFHVVARRLSRKLARMAENLFTHTHRVTYAECTIGNHIYYARYLDLLEAARGALFHHLGLTFLRLHEQGVIFPVVEVNLRYRAAARYDDELRIEVWLTEMERVRLAFGYRVRCEERLIVEGSTRHACTCVNGKLQRIPEELAARLQPYARG